MAETLTSDKIKEAQFITLIMTVEESAMYGLGKLAHPVTQKVERNLIQARAAIDMLEMLSEKTKGNLSEQEKRFLDNTITQLRLNYVEESKSDVKKDGQQNTSGEESASKNES